MKTEDIFYITTPIYYVNDYPHLGTAYTTIVADILNRYQQLFGKETFFLTGTDEHGQKCEQAAREKSLSPQAHCDQMSPQFEKVWQSLGVKYNLFLRTSFDWHKQAVQKALQSLYDKGDIYSANYKGWYCVSEEIFYTEKDLVDGKSPSGREVIPLEEKGWFFKMSKYQEPLKKHLESHPHFIQPDYRQNEIKGFLQKPLQDLCISRPKKRVSWGVELPFDKSCVAYVWVDALLNYITGAGYLRDENKFKKFWEKGHSVHIIGKDILMTHAVYWSCLLMALDLSLPQTILAHGWLLNKDAEKMSKSQGDKLDPMELSQAFGVCELRYFLARSITLGRDSHVSKSLMIKRINEDLADNFGNILSRISRLIEKNFEGNIPEFNNNQKSNEGKKNHLMALTEKISLSFKSRIESFELSQALADLSELLGEVNKYLEREAPWKRVTTDRVKAGTALYNSLEVLRICAILLSPVMPKKMEDLLSRLGETADFRNIQWGRLPLNKKLLHSEPLFPKL